MPVASTGDLVAQAADSGRGVIAFNVITIEHAEAIVTAAQARRTSVIVQISQNAARYHDGVLPIAAACLRLAEAATVPIGLHLDHVEDIALLRQAPSAGFSSAMYDASALPYAENLEATGTAATWAHGAGLWLEAELGHVGGKPGAAASAHTAGVRTDPDEALDFVRRTGVDALAVAVGSSHAMSRRTARLDHRLIADIKRISTVPLVLHGSSGVPDDELRAAVRAGITKINVGTALNLAFTGALRRELGAAPPATDPRGYLAAGRDAMTRTAAALLDVVAVP